MNKMIQLSESALAVAKARYFNDDEDWLTCTLRVASAISEVESDKKYWLDRFHDMLYNMDFIPGGRILRNAGRPKGSCLNCYVIPIGDSIEEIGQCIASALTLWSEGGGCGINFSPLRPKGDSIHGKGGQSSGLVSFMEAIDHVSKTIESGGNRRSASMGCVSVSHPEIIDFINAKLEDGRLSHFNVSVLVNDDFLTAVEKDADWTFTFRGKSYNTVKAREIWDLIMKNMIKSGEPGILNESNLFRNNSYYFAPVVSTNPCGEAILENWGSCCLGSLTLPNFITGAVNTNWQKLEKTIRTAIRFLDNVIDCNKYALKEIDIAGHNSRRVGLGVMGLADYLFAKQVKYGSKESVAEIEKLMRFIRDVAYQTSVELATEKGAFPKFDPVLYGKAHFIRTLPASLRMDIKTKGIRNVTLMAGAPTGTISLLPEVTSGIEPLIYKSYKRSDRVSERIYIHPKYRQLLLSGEPIPEWFVDMTELQPKDHLEVQTAATKFVDGAVSKTINCPFETTENQLSALLLEYLRDLKGVTVYREGSKFGQVYNSLTEEEALEYIAANMVSSSLTEGEIECKCSKKDEEPEQEEIKQEVQIMEI